MQKKYPGHFLTIEGTEGVGKSTAVKYIQQYLKQLQQNVIITREPGGTMVAEKIRQVLLTPSPDEVMQPETELLLMFAARIQHVKNFILPHLAAGKFVVSDRFVDASYAYQGGGRNLDVSRIEMLENWIMSDLVPDVTILLDAPPKIGLTRAKNRGPADRIEQEKIEFFERVRDAYLTRAKQQEKRFRIIDATQSIAKVHQQIKAILDEMCGLKSNADIL